MTEDSRRILELLSQGKITVDEADQLLRALGASAEPGSAPGVGQGDSTRPAPKWVCITVDKSGRDGRPPKQVPIRVPMAVVRGGARLGALIPGLSTELTQKLRDQGVDISAIDFTQIENVLGELGETTINVDEGKGKAQVRITCE